MPVSRPPNTGRLKCATPRRDRKERYMESERCYVPGYNRSTYAYQRRYRHALTDLGIHKDFKHPFSDKKRRPVVSTGVKSYAPD